MKSKIINKKVGFEALVLVLLVAVLLVVTLNSDTTSAYASHSTEFGQAAFSDELFESTMDRFQAQQVSKDISFSGWLYDNRFAGVWYDGQGRLNVGIVDSGTRASANNIRSNGNTNIVYHERQFSWNFLISIHSYVSDIMPIFSIHGVALLPQYNKVEIGLENASYIPVVREHLANKALYESGAVKFVVEEMADL